MDIWWSSEVPAYLGASLGHNIRRGGPIIESVSRAHRSRRSRLGEPVPLKFRIPTCFGPCMVGTTPQKVRCSG